MQHTYRLLILLLLILAPRLASGKLPQEKDASPFSRKQAFPEERYKAARKEKANTRQASFSSNHIWQSTAQSDEDHSLSAPPPGEDGTPQKVTAPMGATPWTAYMLLAMAATAICKRWGKGSSR